MADDNKRYKQIDEDTRAGYNFLNSKYYITNKGTTTYRANLTDIMEVAQALDIPDNPDTGITAEEFRYLSENLETLQKAYYTWQDKGAYIHTIQFNDFKNYPLTIDCEKNKLYIMNSTVIFDLTNGETYRVHVPIICSYYRNELGLFISEADMLIFYNLLTGYFYHPVCYNQIQTPASTTEPLYYNNAFLLSNYNDNARTVYNCLVNPNAQFTDTVTNYITSVNTDTHIVHLAEPINTDILQPNQLVSITGTTYTLNNTEYTADGEYLIQSVDTENNTITTQEPIPSSYQYPYPLCSIITSQSTITSIDRDTSKITLDTQVPDTILVGDTIYIEGTTITQEYETITNDGAYTVLSISANTISIAETFPTNSTTGTLHKQVSLPEILSAEEHTLTLTNLLPQTLSPSTIIRVTMPDTTYNTYTVAEETLEGTDTITVTETVEPYTPEYPTLTYPKAHEDIQISVTYSANLDKFPTGDFIVDNFEQCCNYISLAGVSAVLPTETIINSVSQKVPTTYEVELQDAQVPDEHGELTHTLVMTCAGLYSEIYKDQESY